MHRVLAAQLPPQSAARCRWSQAGCSVHGSCSHGVLLLTSYKPTAGWIQGREWGHSSPCACRGAAALKRRRHQMLFGVRQSARPLQRRELDAAGPQAHSSLFASRIEGKRCHSPPCARPGAVGMRRCRCRVVHGSRHSAWPLQQQELDAAGPQAHSSSDGSETDGKRCHSPPCARPGAVGVNCCEAPGVAQLHEQRTAPTTRRACC